MPEWVTSLLGWPAWAWRVIGARLSAAQIGEFTGFYYLQPTGANMFRYIPDHPPLTFTRHDGTRLVLDETFDTDLGSTPRELWSIHGFAPQDMLPAAILHDWLYGLHHAGKDILGFEESNRVLEEALLSQRPPFIEYTRAEAYVCRAVCDSRLGRAIWDGQG